MKIFGMGGLELVIILVVILLIFGPKNLPKLGSALGKTVSNLRAGMNDGKKKKNKDGEGAESGEGEEGASSGEEGVETSKPAQLEGEVAEVVEVEDGPASSGEHADGTTLASSEEDGEPSQASPSGSAVASPRKVKRVVRRKSESS